MPRVEEDAGVRYDPGPDMGEYRPSDVQAHLGLKMPQWYRLLKVCGVTLRVKSYDPSRGPYAVIYGKLTRDQVKRLIAERRRQVGERRLKRLLG